MFPGSQSTGGGAQAPVEFRTPLLKLLATPLHYNKIKIQVISRNLVELNLPDLVK